MNFRKVIGLALVFSMVILAGCAATVGKDFNESAIDKIVDGETTKSEVVEWFGEPTGRMTASESDHGYTYNFSTSRTGLGTEMKSLNIFFDESGVVSEHLFHSQKY